MVTIQDRQQYAERLQREAMRADEIEKRVPNYELQESIDIDDRSSLWRLVGWVLVLITAISLVSYFVQ